jgi:hypothetical protein
MHPLTRICRFSRCSPISNFPSLSFPSRLSKFTQQQLRIYAGIIAGCGLIIYLIPTMFYHPVR